MMRFNFHEFSQHTNTWGVLCVCVRINAWNYSTVINLTLDFILDCDDDDDDADYFLLCWNCSEHMEICLAIVS
jgi:hypothetical protein